MHPHPTQLNHSLLAIGCVFPLRDIFVALRKHAPYSVLTILLPTASFAALDRGSQSISSSPAGQLIYSGNLLTDATRDHLLRMSRGLAVILLIVFVFLDLFAPSGLLTPRRVV